LQSGDRSGLSRNRHLGSPDFCHFPSGAINQGQQLKVQVSLLGKMPYQRHEMTVIDCDEDNMTSRTNEIGAGVKSWQHSPAVIAQHAGGDRLKKHVEITAGIMTPI
jgi:hypothetical protein